MSDKSASKEQPLTDAEAEAMLQRLSRHFREPVMPIGRHCNGLQSWQRALHDRACRKRAELFPGIDADYYKDPSLKPEAEKAWEAYRAAPKDPYKASLDSGQVPSERCYALDEMRRYEREAAEVGHVFLQIRKSNLLYRLLYGGQSVRAKMCPKHKGKWDGQAMLKGCPHNCDGTGWLREDRVSGEGGRSA